MKLRYEITLSADGKALKKNPVPKNIRRQISADTSRIILRLKTIIGGKLLKISALSEYFLKCLHSSAQKSREEKLIYKI